MQKIIITLALIVTMSFSTAAQFNSEYYKDHQYFVSSSFFMLGNFLPSPPRYYQLNFGYRINSKNTIIAEAITWQYHAPLGIPYSSNSFESDDAKFPGIVRDYGIGLAYQHFIWKRLYATVHVTPFLQQYLTKDEKKIQNGFQLFTVGRLGYHFTILKNKMLIEPSVACTAWPINTNMPADFQVEEDKWNNFFLFEPGLHFGFNF